MQRRSRSHSIQNAAIGIALLACLIALIGHPLFGWGPKPKVYEATPRALVYTAPAPASGRAIVLELAANAARQASAPRSALMPYAYVKRETWRLARQVAGQSVSPRVTPSLTESWLKPDGSGRVLATTSTGRGSRTDDETIQAVTALPRLSTDEAVLARRLARGDLGSDVPAGQLVAITDLADGQPISPPTQAAILRLLARTAGLVNSGTVIDRDGRPGVAVSLDSAYTGVMIGYTLIFDEQTGNLLEAEQTLIGNPSKNLDVQTGAILAYTTFLASGYVANMTTRP
jgi:hypothetical protein